MLGCVLPVHAAAPLDACGKGEVQFKVKTQKTQSPLDAPEAGKAKIVFIEALDGAFMSAPTARFAVDGAWVGADRGASYFTVSVDPGEHTLCARRQSSAKDESSTAEIAKFHMEAGAVYYYELRVQRVEFGPSQMTAGASLPQQYPGSMSAKDHPTIDTMQFKALSPEEAHARLPKLPVSNFTAK
jgi:hypothetical protein